VRSAVAKHGNFRQCGSTALQKSHSPVANRQLLFAVHYLPFTIRHSLLAIVLAQQEPCPPNSFRPSSHAPFLSRWLRKRSLLKQAEKLEGASHDAPKIFGSAGALPSRKLVFVHRLRSVSIKQSLLKQANEVASCGLRVQRKNLTRNFHPSTRNPNSSHLPWVGGQNFHSLLATRYLLNQTNAKSGSSPLKTFKTCSTTTKAMRLRVSGV
jgi:hypothetical protein